MPTVLKSNGDLPGSSSVSVNPVIDTVDSGHLTSDVCVGMRERRRKPPSFSDAVTNGRC